MGVGFERGGQRVGIGLGHLSCNLYRSASDGADGRAVVLSARWRLCRCGTKRFRRARRSPLKVAYEIPVVSARFTFRCAVLASPSLEPPRLRLDGSAQPLRYAVDLTIVPDRDTFHGSVDIDVDIRTPTKCIWLNAIGLAIKKRGFVRQPGAALPAKTVPGGDQFIGFSFDRAVSGKGTSHVVYQGKISRNSSAGIFQLKEDRDWYVYSQFEPTDARRAFPCFDEPSFKVPWQMTLHVPKDDMALSNTPVQSESKRAQWHESGAIQNLASAAQLSGGIRGWAFRRRGCRTCRRDAGASDCSARKERGSRVRRHCDSSIAEIARRLFWHSVSLREAGFGGHAD